MTEIFIGTIISQRKMMNLSNISKILQINPQKNPKLLILKNKWSFLFAKVLFSNKGLISFCH